MLYQDQLLIKCNWFHFSLGPVSYPADKEPKQ